MQFLCKCSPANCRNHRTESLKLTKKKGLIIFIVLTLGLIVGFSARSQQFSYIAAPDVSIVPTPTPAPLDLVQKIDSAKHLLKQSSPLVIEKKKVGRSTQVTRKQIALAILDKATGEITEHRYWAAQNEIQSYSKMRVLNLVPVAQNGALDIRVKWWNSFNSYFEVAGQPDMLIVANKYPLLSQSVPNPKQRSGKEYTDIIYVPYSEALQTPELVQSGKDYIAKLVDSAFASLRVNNVQSRSTLGQLVSDVVNKDFIKNIILVEHIDPIGFGLSDDGGKNLTERVLVLIGANRENAYAYTGSPAGANGIAQFISPTYKTMRLTYPKAKLITDFMLGTATHENAIKAMALFFDAYKAEIQNKVTRKDVLAQIGGVSEEMMSAAYNGGPNRVVRAVNTYGFNWLNPPLSATVATVFRPETLGYLNKFQAIRDLHLF